MRRPVFLVLAAGAVAGLVHGGAVLVLAEPYLDYAIEMENQRLFVSGAARLHAPPRYVETAGMGA